MRTLILCAGEASGDALGASLIAALRAREPELQFAGIGGPAMRAAGMEIWFDSQQLAVMGLVEVLKHLPRLLRLRREFVARVRAARPIAYIGIDAPDFNLPIERRLRSAGLRTLHYVSPSIWAWRRARAKSIGECADKVLCLFPFEPALYARYGVAATFVGHPFADEMPINPDRAAARARLSIRDGVPVLAVLPGSRRGEVARLAKDFFAAAEATNAQVLIPAANAEVRTIIEHALADRPTLAARTRVLDGQMRDALYACDHAIVASGTAALEAFLAKRPMVVGYRIAPLTFWIVKVFGLLKAPYYSLPNKLAEDPIVAEISQNALTPDALIKELRAWDASRLARFERLAVDIHRLLRRGAAERAADAVLGAL